MSFWLKLWESPRLAFALGRASLLLGVTLGWLAMREQSDLQAKFGCVLGAAFFFALWSLLTGVGATASVAEALRRGAIEEHKTQKRSP